MKHPTEQENLFLFNEFGYSFEEIKNLRYFDIWAYREKLMWIDCDECRDKKSRDIAAYLFDVFTGLLPNEWKRLTPPEVSALGYELP